MNEKSRRKWRNMEREERKMCNNSSYRRINKTIISRNVNEYSSSTKRKKNRFINDREKMYRNNKVSLDNLKSEKIYMMHFNG
jgi:hypothetical protein